MHRRRSNLPNSKNGGTSSIDVSNGNTVWHLKLGHDQLHASPLYADGKIYVGLTQRVLIIEPAEKR